MRDLTAEVLTFPLRTAAGIVCRSMRVPPRASSCPQGAAGRCRARRPTMDSRHGRNSAVWAGVRDFVWRGLVDWVIGGLAQGALDPWSTVGSMMEGVLHWPQIIRLAVPGRASRASWAEFYNKADAFRWFATAGTTLGLSGDGAADLGTALRGVEQMSAYQGLWTTEGLGYHQAAALRDGGRSRSLLAGRVGDALPLRSLIPLHTGMGLAFSGGCLEGCTPESPGADVRRQLERFVTLCHDNARGDYWAVSLEALGLSARLLRPRLVPLLDGQLRQMGEDLVHRFWHGVGRGLYFGPATALPCGNIIWPSVRQAYREPPCEDDRRNALAGLGLAATLVNVRHPQVLEGYLESDGGRVSETDAFASGIDAALRIWSCWAPVDGATESLVRHRPATALADRWQRLVSDPVREALRYGQEVAGKDEWPGGLFCYRPRRERTHAGGSGRN